MRFIETIKIENGRIVNPDLHIERAYNTVYHHFHIKRFFDFESVIPDKSPYNNGIYKLRVIYSSGIECFSISPYELKPVRSLQIVDGSKIDYGYKYEDRSEIESLRSLRGDCDDILMVRDGFITDTSYSNIIFSDGVQIFTPSTFVLNGTKRRGMLLAGLIHEKEIRIEDVHKYKVCWMINAMLDISYSPPIPCSSIVIP